MPAIALLVKESLNWLIKVMTTLWNVEYFLPKLAKLVFIFHKKLGQTKYPNLTKMIQILWAC